MPVTNNFIDPHRHEIFVPCGIVEFRDYYLVSSLGRVWSLRRQQFRRPIPKLNTVGDTDKYGYYMEMTLIGAGGYRQTRIPLHRIVAISFLPNPRNLPHVGHINHQKDDNRLLNLYWTCPAQNNGDKPYELRKSKYRKLTDDQAREVRSLYADEKEAWTYNSLAKRYGVSKTQIGQIITGESYKDAI